MSAAGRDLRSPRRVPALRHVDPLAPRGRLYRAYGRLAATRAALRLSRTRLWGAVVWRLDRRLLALTRGRLGTGLLLPTALLQTRGARTGLARRNAVIYFHDGPRPTIVASRAGTQRDPAWLHNLRAEPEVLLAGAPYRAELVREAAERARLWALADRVFPAFAAYRASAAQAGRRIEIVQLTPRDPG